MKRLLRSAGLVLLGAALGFGAERIVGRGGEDDRASLLEALATRQGEEIERMSSAVEARARTTQELALSQFYRLQEFRQFGSEGQGLVWLVPLRPGERDPTAVAAAGRAVRVPRLALEAAARTTWVRAAGRLTSLQGSVDPRIYEAFEDVRGFADGHPWPAASGLDAVERAGWTSPDVVERWLTLNRTLVSRVDAVLAGL